MIERFLKIRKFGEAILYLMKIIPFKRVNLHLPKVAFSSYDLVLGRIYINNILQIIVFIMMIFFFIQ
jgi:hypothetical protein